MGTQAVSNGRYHTPKSSVTASKAAILMTMLFIAPLLIAAPSTFVEEAPSMTSGKSTDPDVAVTDLNVTTPSVIGPTGNPTLAPMEHIIRITISNLGGLGVDAFTPVINPPQCAVLGIGRIQEKVIWQKEQAMSQERLTLNLTFDHRIVDGAPAARFLEHLALQIENPSECLMH